VTGWPILQIGFHHSIIGQMNSVYGHRVALAVWIESWLNLMYFININRSDESITDEGLSTAGSEQIANGWLSESMGWLPPIGRNHRFRR